MSRTRVVFSIAVVALLVATPAMGQLANFPVLALGAGDGVIAVGGGYGRGLNNDSGKLNSIGVGVSRSMEMVSFGVSGGLVLSDTGAGLPSSEVTLAGRVAYHLPIGDDSPVNVSVQGGIGWEKPGDSPADVTLLFFPVGVSLSGTTTAGSLEVRPWVMPRVQFTRFGEFGIISSNTQTDFGASAGVGATTESGFGFGVSGDLLIVDDGAGGNNSVFLVAAGVFYRLP